MRKLIVLLLLVTIVGSCTSNTRARRFGGKEVVKLKPNEVLLNMTWKEDNLWLQTIDTTTNIQYFRENSSWGMLEGEIVIN